MYDNLSEEYDEGVSTEDEEYQEELQDQYEEESIPDSGHGSLLLSHRADSVFSAKTKVCVLKVNILKNLQNSIS